MAKMPYTVICTVCANLHTAAEQNFTGRADLQQVVMCAFLLSKAARVFIIEQVCFVTRVAVWRSVSPTRSASALVLLPVLVSRFSMQLECVRATTVQTPNQKKNRKLHKALTRPYGADEEKEQASWGSFFKSMSLVTCSHTCTSASPRLGVRNEYFTPVRKIRATTKCDTTRRPVSC
nr:hypothetical protein CFP56_54960 [Quercus suber]